MKQQPSKRAIELRLEWLNKALGRPLEPWTWIDNVGSKPNAGNFHLDHQLGGYRIEMLCEKGGSTPIFGHARMSKAALVDQLEAILVAIKLAREEKHGGAWPLSKDEQLTPTLRDALELAQATIQRLERHAPGSANGTLDVIKKVLTR